MAARKITVVDLYATMTACGNVTCGSCKPHCGAAGYNYLVDKAIVPAIKKALVRTYSSRIATTHTHTHPPKQKRRFLCL